MPRALFKAAGCRPQLNAGMLPDAEHARKHFLRTRRSVLNVSYTVELKKFTQGAGAGAGAGVFGTALGVGGGGGVCSGADGIVAG